MTKRSEDAWYAVGDEVRTYRGTLLTVNEWLTDEDAEEVCRTAAAAPMMLRALEEAYAWFMPGMADDEAHPDSLVGHIRSAIKAARGEDYDE
jgi:hypothetical protein